VGDRAGTKRGAEAFMGSDLPGVIGAEAAVETPAGSCNRRDLILQPLAGQHRIGRLAEIRHGRQENGQGQAETRPEEAPDAGPDPPSQGLIARCRCQDRHIFPAAAPFSGASRVSRVAAPRPWGRVARLSAPVARGAATERSTGAANRQGMVPVADEEGIR
jgi:hypothetical protein